MTTTDEQRELHREVIDQISILLTSAFGIAAALSWNSAIQAIFKSVFGTADTVFAQLLYAVIITVIAVIVTRYVARAKRKITGTKLDQEI